MRSSPQLIRSDRPVDEHSLRSNSITSSSESMISTDHSWAQPESSRSSSIFRGRSRGKTASSTSSNTLEGAAYAERSTAPRPMSQGDRCATPSSHSMSNERSDGRTRSFFSRSGRRLRRQNSKLSITSFDASSWAHESENVSERQSVMELDHEIGDASSKLSVRKRNISEPFNFQHVTHTSPGQFPALDRATANELASEFSAVRAAQAPRQGLRGIKVDDLNAARRASIDVQAAEGIEASTTMTAADLGSRRSRHIARVDSETSISSRKSFKYACSIETPKTNALRSLHSPTGSINPPPRTSSKSAVTRHFESSMSPPPRSPAESDAERSACSSEVNSPVALSPVGSFTSRPMAMTELDDLSGPLGMPHAVTTPDDTARQLRPAIFASGTELADVPEEEESCAMKRMSTGSQRPQSPASLLRLTQSLSNMQNLGKHEKHLLQAPKPHMDGSGPLRRTSSQASETLGGGRSSSVVRTALVHPSSEAKADCVGLRSVDGSWEDDIDYCYDHAVEADFDYDWDRWTDDEDEADDGHREGADRKTALSSSPLPQQPTSGDKDSQGRKPLRLLATPFSTEADTSPLTSASTNDSEVITPQFSNPPHAFPLGHYKKSGSFADSAIGFSPATLMPCDDGDDVLEGDFLEGILATRASEHQAPLHDSFLDQTDSFTDSCRSSGAPLSKRASQESFIMMGERSPFSQHCSVHSASSIPDLVPSNKRRQAFDDVTARLTKHLESLDDSSDVAAAHAKSMVHPAHRRTKSSTKDAGRQSMLKQAASNSSAGLEHYPLAARDIRRERSQSDTDVSESNREPAVRKMKSTGSMALGRTHLSNRASYVLFPTT
ncbi:MAG: hypothetical protein M1825_000935 [Sarcosagium campestre]|nr:MAG: hypothetical protein M1825_000935 [Sarcosagium campestre]